MAATASLSVSRVSPATPTFVRASQGRNSAFPERTRFRFAGATALAAVALAWAMAATVSVAQAADAPGITSENTPVARYDGKTLTAGDLSRLVAESSGRDSISWEMLGQFPPERIRQFLEGQIVEGELARMAREDSEWERPGDIAVSLAEVRDRLLMQQLYKITVTDRLTTPTQEDLQAYYEENKDNYKTHFSFSMRHLYLPTYQDYTAKAGDTPLSIAETVSLDPKAATRVLFKATKRHPGEPEDADTTLDPATRELHYDLGVVLNGGEELLVPMTPAKTLRVKERIFELHKQLVEGGDFQELAAEHSEAASGGEPVTLTPSPERPMLPEILDVVRATEIGSFSEPFQTKHGWQIIQVVRRTEEGHRPLDEVAGAIRHTLERQQTQKLTEAFIRESFEAADLVVLNPDALNPMAPPDAIVASVPGYRYTRQDLLIDHPEEAKNPIEVERAQELVQGVSRIQHLVLLHRAEAMKIGDLPEVKKTLENRENTLVSQHYAQHRLDKKSAAISEPELETYYRENSERFATPPKFDLSVIGVTIDAEGRSDREAFNQAREAIEAKMEEWKAQIEDLETFQRFAKEHSVIMPEKGGHVGLVPPSYQNGFNGVLETIEIGKVTGPVSTQNRTHLLWVDSKTPSVTPPFAEVHDQVKQAFTAAMKQKWELDLRKTLLESRGFEFLLSPPDSE